MLSTINILDMRTYQNYYRAYSLQKLNKILMVINSILSHSEKNLLLISFVFVGLFLIY